MKKAVIVVIVIAVLLLIGLAVVLMTRKVEIPSVDSGTALPPAANLTTLMSTTACPAGWTDQGEFGVIVENTHAGKSPLRVGGPYNSGWTWGHGRLCHGDANTAPAGMYQLRTTPSDTAARVGVLGKTLENVGFEKGGTHYGWNWYHPYLGSVNDPSAVNLLATGTEMSGFLMNKNDLAKTSYQVGGAHTPDWTWVHPYVARV